jgi:hypothetical protein
MNRNKGTVEGFFTGKPEELQLFNAVRECVKSLGEVTIEVTKTLISFGTKESSHGSGFPPSGQKKVRKRASFSPLELGIRSSTTGS